MKTIYTTSLVQKHVHGEISSDLYRHQKTLRIIFLQTAMIPTFVLKLVGVNIYENIKGQPYFNSRNFLWVLFVLLVTP